MSWVDHRHGRSSLALALVFAACGGSNSPSGGSAGTIARAGAAGGGGVAGGGRGGRVAGGGRGGSGSAEAGASGDRDAGGRSGRQGQGGRAGTGTAGKPPTTADGGTPAGGRPATGGAADIAGEPAAGESAEGGATAGGGDAAGGPPGVAGAGATGGSGDQPDPCATNNGGCDQLTRCSSAGGTRSCSACPRGYTGTGETGCTPNLCEGAPGPDCACIKVTPSGDDELALASHGASAFRNVQPALDFSFAHPEVSAKVCVASPDCRLPWPRGGDYVFGGPVGADLTMHDGVSLYGSYEASGFTRCSQLATALSLTSPAGVLFPDTIVHPTELDGFVILHFDAPSTTAISVPGAKGVGLSWLRLEGGTAAADSYGIDASDGAILTATDLMVAMPTSGSALPVDTLPTGKVYGIRAVDSQVTVDSCALDLIVDGVGAYGIWLENASDAVVQDSTLVLEHRSGELTGIHVEGAGATLTDNTVSVAADRGPANGVGAELIDAGDVTWTGRISVYGDGLRVVRSKLDATLELWTGSQDGPDTTGVLLDTSPGSVIRGVMHDSPNTLVRVVGDATDTVIEDFTADVHESSRGIVFSDCGGAAPRLTRSSVRVRGYADPEEAVSSSGDCHPRIENNTLLSAVLIPPRLHANAIHCDEGSLCAISGNADIHVELETGTFPYTFELAGIRCESGSCGDIASNQVAGLWGASYWNLTQGLQGVRTYGIVSAGAGVIAKNVVRGGYGVTGTGLVVSGGVVENNIVTAAYGIDAHIHDVSGTALDVGGPVDVESNTLIGTTASPYNGGCFSSAGVNFHAGAATFRNNIISGLGACGTADFAGGIPASFENNDLLHAAYLAGGTLLEDMAAINALGPGFSGNFSASPGFASSDDLHLTAGSACIDAGTPDGAPPDDIDGDPRDAHPDVGADEYVSSPPPNP